MFEERLRAVYPGLQPNDVTVLRALLHHAPIQARTLAKRTALAQSTLFRCLVALEDAGLIETQADHDPLRRMIALTATGAAFKSLA